MALDRLTLSGQHTQMRHSMELSELCRGVKCSTPARALFKAWLLRQNQQQCRKWSPRQLIDALGPVVRCCASEHKCSASWIESCKVANTHMNQAKPQKGLNIQQPSTTTAVSSKHFVSFHNTTCTSSTGRLKQLSKQRLC